MRARGATRPTDGAMVREQLRPVIAAHLLGWLDQPIVVDLHLDGVELGDERAPRGEETEEGADAPAVGQLAKDVRLQRPLHLQHVAPHRLVGEQKHLRRPVEAIGFAQDGRREVDAGDHLGEVTIRVDHALDGEEVLLLKRRLELLELGWWPPLAAVLVVACCLCGP